MRLCNHTYICVSRHERGFFHFKIHQKSGGCVHLCFCRLLIFQDKLFDSIFFDITIFFDIISFLMRHSSFLPHAVLISQKTFKLACESFFTTYLHNSCGLGIRCSKNFKIYCNSITSFIVCAVFCVYSFSVFFLACVCMRWFKMNWENS